MPKLAMSAKCVICRRVFSGPSLLMIGTSQTITKQHIDFVMKLRGHIEQDHKDLSNSLTQVAKNYEGLLFLAQYETHSPEFHEQLDRARWAVHQETLNRRISDEEIATAVGQLVPEIMTLCAMNDIETLKRNLISWAQSMRNVLEEPGKYPYPTAETPERASKVAPN